MSANQRERKHLENKTQLKLIKDNEAGEVNLRKK